MVLPTVNGAHKTPADNNNGPEMSKELQEATTTSGLRPLEDGISCRTIYAGGTTVKPAGAGKRLSFVRLKILLLKNGKIWLNGVGNCLKNYRKNMIGMLGRHRYILR